MATMTLVTCRTCGAKGYQTPDEIAHDPAPGVCPACMERGMDWATLRALEHLLAGLRDGALVRAVRADFVAIGLRPAAAQEYVMEAVQAAATRGKVS